MATFVYGSFVYEYELVREDRKTLSLAVMPNLKICVKCPQEAEEERIELFLKRKWFWLQKQLNFFKKFQREVYKREYVSGESFLYLGRQYKLLVRSSRKDDVIFSKGAITIFTTKSVRNGTYNKKLLDFWYAMKTEKIFSERFSIVKNSFDYEKMPKLGIRKMEKRWGSYLNNEKIFLNPRLIQASKECIDYVITHELCHMRYKNHDKKFFTFLEKKFPKWEKTKDKLESYLGN